MTVKRARIVFAVLMQAAREGKHLTQYDKQQLSIARQTLRQIRKPIMNKRSSLHMPTPRELKAKSVGSKVGGGYIASFTTYDRAEYGKHILEEWGGLDVSDITRSAKTGDLLVTFFIRKPSTSISNPRGGVLIYGKVNRIIATKLQKHICDAECKRHGHRYFHDFTSRAKMYGLPNGDLLITTR